MIQEPQLGTGHAVKVAQAALPASGTVLVLFGDTPLLTRGDAGAAGRRHARPRMRPWRCWACGPPIPPAMADCRSTGERLVAVIEDRDADAGPEARRRRAIPG